MTLTIRTGELHPTRTGELRPTRTGELRPAGGGEVRRERADLRPVLNGWCCPGCGTVYPRSVQPMPAGVCRDCWRG